VNRLRRWKLSAAFAAIALLVASSWYAATKPQRDADRLLRVLRVVQVGQTSTEELNTVIQRERLEGVGLTCSPDLEHRPPIASFPSSTPDKPYELTFPETGSYRCLYNLKIRNTLLSRLKLAPLSGQFAYIWTDDKRTTGIELHSLVGSSTTNHSSDYVANVVYRQILGHPGCGRETCVARINPSPEVAITVSASAPLFERNRFLAINTACFAKLGGCKSAKDLLPLPDIE